MSSRLRLPQKRELSDRALRGVGGHASSGTLLKKLGEGWIVSEYGNWLGSSQEEESRCNVREWEAGTSRASRVAVGAVPALDLLGEDIWLIIWTEYNSL
jgi:hypothetical protein